MRSPLLALALLLVLPKLPLCQSSTLGKAPFNGLQARVAAIRFFESGGVIPDPKQRVFTTRFDALTTRFIFFELELAYAAARKRTPFQVECVFEGPDGKLRERTLSGTVEPGWTGSYHAAGVGSPERGQWAEGVYQVGCREAGQPIVRTSLEVVKSAAAVGKLGAAIVQLKFYQSLAERSPVETRRYSTRFDTRTARWIKSEFALVYPQLAAPTTFSVECAYVFPDKSVKRVTVERRIPAGWTGSVHAQGIQPESWPVGRYTVSCWNNGEKMAERTFEVFESGIGNRESGGGGRLRFYAAKLRSAADPAYATAFALEATIPCMSRRACPCGLWRTPPASLACSPIPPELPPPFPLRGVLERDLVARGRRYSGSSQAARRLSGGVPHGPRAAVAGRFEVTGEPERPELDIRLLTHSLFASEEEPGDGRFPMWCGARRSSNRSGWSPCSIIRPMRASARWPTPAG
jgi:hypothetical protein